MIFLKRAVSVAVALMGTVFFDEGPDMDDVTPSSDDALLPAIPGGASFEESDTSAERFRPRRVWSPLDENGFGLLCQVPWSGEG